MLTTTCTCNKCQTIITASNALPPVVEVFENDRVHPVYIVGPAPHREAHFCLHCFIDAVNALDDRPRETPAKGRTE